MEKKKERKIVEPILITGLLAVIIFTAVTLIPKYIRNSSEKTVYLEKNWYYMKDGEKIEVDFPLSVTKNDNEPFVLYNDSLTAEAAGRTISTKGAKYDLSAVMDGQILYAYEDAEFPRNSQMADKLSCDWVLPLEVEGKTLELYYQNKENGKYEIKEILIGKSGYIFGCHLRDSALVMMIVFFMAILGVIAIGVAIYLRRIHILDKRFSNVAVFLLICGIWCATDSSLVQHLTDLSPITNYISFYAFMLLAVPMLHCVQNTGEMAKYKVLDVLIWMLYINAIAQGLINYFYKIPMIDMLFVSHVLLFGGVGTTMVVLVKEYRANKDKELYTILSAFAMVGAGGVLAMILYWLLEITFYDFIFECGILVFIFIILFQIISTTAHSMQFKTEMLVYRRLAKEDKLTGMSNRRAFEEYLMEIEGNADTYENLALIFMDINGLKQVNDTHGHSAGDELIIAASKTIDRAFGKKGKCFRIGGDEFCAILPNPGNGDVDWNEPLDRELKRYNQMAKYTLEIARGISYLRDENGVLRTFSDWKYEADQKMYRNKGWRRIDESGTGDI